MGAKRTARPRGKSDTTTRTPLSDEVQLAWEVMTCLGLRTTYDRPDSPCHWFAKHYGPYPAYSLVDKQPLAIIPEGDHIHLSVKTRGMRYSIPEIISGCRKAPIMSIGINPNLTSYQHTVRGATWCYPYFDDLKKYAEHFRRRTINQERFESSFIERHIAKDARVVARRDGIVTKVFMGTDNVAIDVRYNGGGLGTLHVPVDYVVLRDPSSGYREFKAGDVLAGRLELPEDMAATVTQESVGYYAEFHKILERFKAMDKDLAASKFQIGEDASQGDMVSCPSPGWSAYFPDAVREGIVNECVLRRRHLVRQFAQSRPAVVLFVGNSALQMFLQELGKDKQVKAEIMPHPDLQSDTMELLRDCASKEYWLHWRADGADFKSRVIFAPHFSYRVNFTPGCWLTSKQWSDFSRQFSGDAKVIEDAKKLNKQMGSVHVHTDMKDKLWRELDAKARQFLKGTWLDPVETIASVLLDEYNRGRLRLDEKTGHLVRAEGPCSFCWNELFQLAHGCHYGKTRRHAKEAR